MKLYSTNNKNNVVSFKQAVQKGIADDGGLFMPVEIPKLPGSFFKNISDLSFSEISLRVAKTFLKDEIPEADLSEIINKTITFDAPLKVLEKGLYILELFHGPTLAFKDFGARFMANVLSYFLKNEDRQVTILVATSGDTGSAVANGFYKAEGIRVILLYPSGKVSKIQEQQLTTLDSNVTALEVEGTFDDCQRLVKQAFADSELNERLNLSSANSINFARLLPQSFYYFNSYAGLTDREKPFIVSVPSGNFGNLTAGLIAKEMGLPVKKFIAATNINDIVPKYLESSIFCPRASQQTISNAMDVGNPSNFARISALYDNTYNIVKENISGASFTDDETRRAIKEVKAKYNYTIDPHGAVGYLALKKFVMDDFKTLNAVILETAHPAKFVDIIEDVLESKVDIPARLAQCLNKEKHSIKLSKNFVDFKACLFTL